jgi:two-component sensor histidine kinase
MMDRDVLKDSWHDWWSFSVDPRGPGWLQWAWTGLFCLGIAVALTAIVGVLGGHLPKLGSLWPLFRDNLVISMTIGLLIQLFYELSIPILGMPRLRRFRQPQVWLYWSVLALAGTLIGWPLGMTLTGRDLVEFANSHPQALRGSLVFATLMTLAMFVWIQTKTSSVEAERRVAQAQLKLLQAQIEPHFLFNTLANVLSLMEADPQRAKRMLETFTDYLRTSLGQMRHEHHTVAQELELVQAYLQLLQMRMDDRLRFRLDADERARRALVPALLLQPLVENAVHHGLEAKVDGGEVTVRAWVEGARLHLEVCDDGLGLDAPPRARGAGRGGNGMALANIRERLAARYGSSAMLTLVRREPGTCALLTLPCEEPNP